MKLEGRKAIITGANQGFGEAVAAEFVRQGADVFICARDKTKLEAARNKLRGFAGPKQKIGSRVTDISREEEVKQLMESAVAELGRVDILVNNAGIYGPKNLVEDMDSGEWARTLQTNLLGVFYCCKHAVASMKKNGYGKIINLSGGGGTAPLPNLSAYAVSKAGVVRFTETLAEECKGAGVDVNAVAPGALNTRLLEEVLAAGPQAVGKEFYAKALEQKKNGGAPLESGAGLCVFLASAASDGITGKLISALWDPWKDLAEHREVLQKTDIYTLRRIVPKDRNQSWGDV